MNVVTLDDIQISDRGSEPYPIDHLAEGAFANGEGVMHYHQRPEEQCATLMWNMQDRSLSAPQCKEKLSALIKGLLPSKIIQHFTSPWASPIVIIVKKNGIYIRLYIDYRRVGLCSTLMICLKTWVRPCGTVRSIWPVVLGRQ